MTIKGRLFHLVVGLAAAWLLPTLASAAGPIVWDYEINGRPGPALSAEDRQTLIGFVKRAFPEAGFSAASPSAGPAVWLKKGGPGSLDAVLALPDRAGNDLSPAVICPVAPFVDAKLTASQMKRWPFTALGKLFTDCSADAGPTALGSGAVIGKNLVLTAASNIYDGAFVDKAKLCFSPAYYNGEAPHGTWRPVSLGVLSLYRVYEWPCVNVGFMVMETSNNRSISSFTGEIGLIVNIANRGREFYTLGYPEDAYGGLIPIITRAYFALDDESESGWSCSPPMGIGGEMGEGAQGGPWLTEYGGDWYINGLTAYTYSACPEVQYSPFFGDEALRGYREVE